MSHSRVNGAGWVAGNRLTAAQMNQLDTNVSNCVDKRSPGLEVDSRSVTRTLGMGFPGESSGTSVLWNVDTHGWKTNSTAASRLQWDVNVPHGCTITNITIGLDPAAHGALPASMPQAFLISTSDAGVVASLASWTDTSANFTIYSAFHSISSGAISIAVDRATKFYRIELVSESGANSVAGMAVYTCKVTFTTTRIDEL